MLDNSGGIPSKQHGNNTVCQSIIKRIIWLIQEEEGGDEVMYQT